MRPEWINLWLWNPGKLQKNTSMPNFFTNDDGPTIQDKQFFKGVPDDQIRALVDLITHHDVYKTKQVK